MLMIYLPQGTIKSISGDNRVTVPDIIYEFPSEGGSRPERPVVIPLVVQVLEDQPVLIGPSRLEARKEEPQVLAAGAKMRRRRVAKGEIEVEGFQAVQTVPA